MWDLDSTHTHTHHNYDMYTQRRLLTKRRQSKKGQEREINVKFIKVHGIENVIDPPTLYDEHILIKFGKYIYLQYYSSITMTNDKVWPSRFVTELERIQFYQ